MATLTPKKPIILASGSPRRQALLEQLGLSFQVKKSDVDETYHENWRVEAIPVNLAIRKAQYFNALSEDHLIIGADTIVTFQGQVLGKPEHEADAHAYLSMLSGQTHQVISGCSIIYNGQSSDFIDITEVKFKELNQEVIEHYIKHYQPFDKAGAYAIQEWMGLVGVEWIKGSYANVVGLPVHKVYEALLKLG